MPLARVCVVLQVIDRRELRGGPRQLLVEAADLPRQRTACVSSLEWDLKALNGWKSG